MMKKLILSATLLAALFSTSLTMAIAGNPSVLSPEQAKTLAIKKVTSLVPAGERLTTIFVTANPPDKNGDTNVIIRGVLSHNDNAVPVLYSTLVTPATGDVKVTVLGQEKARELAAYSLAMLMLDVSGPVKVSGNSITYEGRGFLSRCSTTVTQTKGQDGNAVWEVTSSGCP